MFNTEKIKYRNNIFLFIVIKIHVYYYKTNNKNTLYNE